MFSELIIERAFLELIIKCSPTVAIQCLESSYDVSSSDAHLLASKKLEDIFKEGTKDQQWKVMVHCHSPDS